MPHVHVRNLQRKFRVDALRLQKFAERALRLSFNLKQSSQIGDQPSELFVLLVSDQRMAALHRRFLNATGPTDVITFQHGEIFISVPTTRRNAARFGNSPVREIKLCIVHGLLHLLGYGDQDETNARKMRAAQTKVLKAALG